MNTQSLWEAISKRSAHYPAPTKAQDVDVVIIGAGITGITAASQLIEAGKTVAVIEALQVGGVTTSYSTGNLYVPVQPFYQHIVSKFNLETAITIAKSRQSAIDFIEKKILDNHISCHFARRPWYGYTANHERISLDKEVEFFKKVGIPIEYTNELPLPFKFKKAVVIPNQARFNPLQYVISMAEDLATKGCLIFENTRVMEMEEKNDRCVVKTEHTTIHSKKIFVATHTPIGINLAQMYTAPYRSYVVAVQLEDKHYPEGHFWDLDCPPHATCTHATSGKKPNSLMVAGSHHKTGKGTDTKSHYKELQSFLKKHFEIAEFTYQWSAQHYQSADNIPYMGLANRHSKNTYIATGYFADGLVYGTIAGILISDVILGKSNSLREIYQSNRFKPIASVGFVAKENNDVLLQYLQDFPILEAPDYTNIKPGEGKIVEINREKCAVSRDNDNTLHIVSAVCTHMKCIVNWNNAEQTWDCPCHGSRFTQQGVVIEGPAKLNLKSMKKKEN